ncbi:hypothetical protein Pcinc_043865 [Petrolisthes cinctipes]|uniref:PiggyBac transposable element-derived protein domain-containing protein n=1 Tax=Petrolisthes cinctipes TaxID=88211 RepID=A0AAE1BER0_PETCI|nr:hypothetical protein Pcinc_043865 [Petrolisthes cinctipes]
MEIVDVNASDADVESESDDEDETLAPQMKNHSPLSQQQEGNLHPKDLLTVGCLKVTPEEHNSIDEMMIPFKGGFSGIKQYVKGKHHKWVFKNWARAGQSVMLYDFDVYQGSGDNRSNKSGLEVAADVVLKLTSTLPDNNNFKVYADNFFTGLPLIEELQKHSIHYVGTARSNRVYNCSLQSDSDLQKGGRGSYERITTLWQ